MSNSDCNPPVHFFSSPFLRRSAFELLQRTHAYFPMLFEIGKESNPDFALCSVRIHWRAGFGVLARLDDEELATARRYPASLRNVSLEKGTFIELQPHSVDSLDIRNPKAALEETLSTKFFSITTGDTILINYDGMDYYVDILKTKPAPAICIIDTACEVDFAPLDYEEPGEHAQPAKEEQSKEGPNFVLFSGSARRLDDKPSVLLNPSFLQEHKQKSDEVPSTATGSEFRSHKRPGKTVRFS